MDKKSTIRNSLVYAIGNVATKVIGLLLIPLYTNPQYLTVDDFGILGILEITSQVLIAVLSFSMPQCLTRWYWDENYKAKQKSIVFTTLVFLLFISALFYVAIYPFLTTFSNLLFSTVDFSYVLKLLILSAIVQVVVQQILTLAKLNFRSKIYTSTSVIKLILGLLLTIYFIVVKGKKMDGIFEAQLYSNLFHLILLTPLLIKNVVLKLEKKILHEMVLFAYPLILASIFGVFLNAIDRYSLNFLTSLQEVGIYSLAFKISSTLRLTIVMSIQLAISPIIYKKMSDPNAPSFYSGLMNKFGFILMFFSVGLALFSYEIIKLITGSAIYWEANYLIPTLILGVFFGMLRDVSQIGLNIKKKTKIIGTVIILISVLNLGLNILLIPIIDYHGAALSTLLSQIIYFVIIYKRAQKEYFIPYNIKKLLMLLIIGSLFMYSGLLINDLNVVFRLGIKCSAIVVLPLLLFYFNFFEKNEIELISALWDKWRNPNRWFSNMKELGK